MSLEQRIEQDLKTALLARDRRKTTTLRGLKNSLIYAKVGKSTQGTTLNDDEVISILSREAKKRQESADLYKQGGNAEREQAELEEKALIEIYLPAQLSEAELALVVRQTVSELAASGPSAMGQVIGAVKKKTAGAAAGATIARLVRATLAETEE